MNEQTDKLESALEKRRDSPKFDKTQRVFCTSLTKGIGHVKPIGWMVIQFFLGYLDMNVKWINFFFILKGNIWSWIEIILNAFEDEIQF